MSAPTTGPRDEYARRLADRREGAARQARIELSISNGRLATAVAAAILAWLAFGAGSLGAWWLLAPLALFAVLVVAHDRVIERRRLLERAASFYEAGLARLDHAWMGKGEPGERFLEEEHLYAPDLDLFGAGSLFELLCSARTRAGEGMIAAWLLAPAPREVILSRQEAVRELRGRIDLREDLAILGAAMRAEVDAEALAGWGAEPRRLALRPDRAFAFILSSLTLIAAALWAAGVAGSLPLTAVLAVEGAFAWRRRHAVARVVAGIDGVGRDLALLSGILGRLERETFTSPHLARLRATLDIDGDPPSRRIARLNRLVELLDSRRNQLFAPLAAALLWATQVALAIESWRATSGEAVGRWLAATGEMEALCALAAFAYEHPEYADPEIVEGPALFEAERLGHPLLPAASCVRNDVRIGEGRRVLIVSGSNMSGKSTLLRAAGINAALALAGAPVCAGRLRLSPLAIGASIRIHDSLQAGTSRFYAEITRLRRIVDLTKSPLPVLFLIDEMLNGTNSHDRRIGAGAVVRGLASRGAVGLITTHDLALAHIAEIPEAAAENVHFEDHIEAGKITFDYVMRPGVVTKSNGLALMRAVGLDVEEEAPERAGRGAGPR
jgi:hypothetical protein